MTENTYTKGIKDTNYMAETTKHPGGRPPMFNTVDEMQILIDKYFIECKGTPLLNKDDIPMLNKYEEPIMFGSSPPTVTGMALYLGFTSRQALINYQNKEEFVDSITQAKSRIEQYAETKLYSREASNGAKFVLINNYGWKEKSEVESTGSLDVNNKVDLTGFSVEQLKDMLKE